MTREAALQMSPHAKRFLDASAAAAFPPTALHDESIAAEYLQRARQRTLIRANPEPVGRIVEERLASGVPVRLYIPDLASVAPVLLYFHGGGWVMGDLDSNDPTCRRLANAAGVIVVSVDYRLAPEHPFPSGLNDAAEALDWVRAEIGRFGGDPERIAIGGSSAGANLAVALTLQLRRAAATQPAMQVLLYPPLDSRAATPSFSENAVGYSLSADQMRWFWRTYAPDDLEHPLVSPAREADLAGIAPAYLVVAGFDPLRDEGCTFADRLRDARVAVEVDYTSDQIHGFVNQVGLWPDADATASRIATWLRAGFGTATHVPVDVPTREEGDR